MKNPTARLLARALLAGLAVALADLHGHAIDRAALETALVAGAWAAVEALTPLNALVGLGKAR